MHKIKSILGFALAYIKLICLYPFGKLFYGKKRLWLFCERGDDAKDNAFVFFNWINKNHPEIQSVYLIDRNSYDYEKVKRVGTICRYKSIKHWLMFIGSTVRLGTHLFFYVPNRYLAVYYMKHHKKSGLDVFLQHGITHNWQDCFYKANNNSNIVICGVESEYEYLVNNFDLGKNVLKNTGFPRFDTLINKEKQDDKFILVMPTWRQWLANLNDEEILKSDFFSAYSNLIRNETLLKWMRNNKYKVILFLHPSFSKFRRLFCSFSNENVEIVSEDYDVQDLLCRASILITDYSSILFDFAYLKKPSIYFQFDSDLFYSKQYRHGYFIIKNDGFGPTINTVESLITEIQKNTIIQPFYLDRINRFFANRDTHNCKRVFSEIMMKYEN